MGKADLKPVRSKGEAKERGSKGGVASGAARRAKRDLRAHMQALLDGQREGMSGAEALTLALFEKALGGDVRAYEAVLATAGQTPRQPVTFPLPEVQAVADLPRLTASILQSVAAGQLTPDEGGRLAGIVTAHGKALEQSELEQRIAALEAQHADRNSR